MTPEQFDLLIHSPSEQEIIKRETALNQYISLLPDEALRFRLKRQGPLRKSLFNTISQMAALFALARHADQDADFQNFCQYLLPQLSTDSQSKSLIDFYLQHISYLCGANIQALGRIEWFETKFLKTKS